MKLVKVFFLILILNSFLFKNIFALENKILIKINNEIISTVDLYNEAQYLKLINPKIVNLSDSQIYELSKNSLIKEKIKKIKKIELLRHYNQLDINNELEEQLINEFITRNKIQNFESFILENNMLKEEILEKIKINGLWNRIIVKKFLSKVKIDEKNIENEIKKSNFQFEYFLSEIVFTVNNSEDLKKKYETIKKEINNNGFSKTATILSVSNTAKNGGELGWIKESSLSKKIKDQIKQTKVGQITNPIIIPGGFLILKIDEQRKIDRKIDTVKEKKLIIINKTNEQLNSYSRIYYNKIMKNIKIYEQ